jgi:hypothetical protein
LNREVVAGLYSTLDGPQMCEQRAWPLQGGGRPVWTVERRHSGLTTYRESEGEPLSSLPTADTVLGRHGWDFAAAALLLYAAYLLAHVADHYYVYHRYGYGIFHGYGTYRGYGSMRYEAGTYFERLRLIVCGSWILAAFRFYYYKLLPIALFALVIAWLFNPILPVTMSRLRWQPYDHWTMVCSLAAALVLVVLSYKQRNTPVAGERSGVSK